jgi:hypothetical protein
LKTKQNNSGVVTCAAILEDVEYSPKPWQQWRHIMADDYLQRKFAYLFSQPAFRQRPVTVSHGEIDWIVFVAPILFARGNLPSGSSASEGLHVNCISNWNTDQRPAVTAWNYTWCA